MWEAALFDFDGTIVNSEFENIEILVEVLNKYNISVTEGQRKWFAAHSWDDCIKRIKYDYINIQKVDIFKEISELLDSSTPPLLPGIENAIITLKGSCKLAVVSGSSENVIKRVLSHYSLLSYFELIIGRESVDESKPSPKPYLVSSDLLNIVPIKCIVFEDSEIGVTSAVKANMCVCAVEIGNEFGQDLHASFCKVPSLEYINQTWLQETWAVWARTS